MDKTKRFGGFGSISNKNRIPGRIISTRISLRVYAFKSFF